MRCSEIPPRGADDRSGDLSEDEGEALSKIRGGAQRAEQTACDRASPSRSHERQTEGEVGVRLEGQPERGQPGRPRGHAEDLHPHFNMNWKILKVCEHRVTYGICLRKLTTWKTVGAMHEVTRRPGR